MTDLDGKEQMQEYNLPVEQVVKGVGGQMLKTGHCNICGAVLVISVDGTPFSADDPEMLQHAQWHRAIFAGIEDARKGSHGSTRA